MAKNGDNKQSLIIEAGITGSKEVITDLEAINTLVKDTKGRNVNVNVKTTGINETSVKNIKDITAQLTKLQNVSNNIEKSVKLNVDGSTIKDLQKQLDGVTANIGVEVKKSSINDALKEIRKVLSGKTINVTLTPHLDASKEKFDGKRAIDRIKQYVNSVFKDVEVDIKPKFNTNSIRASIRNLKQELNKVAGTETDTKVNTLIMANHRGNIDSPEMLSSWIDQISRFSRVAKKIPHGLINVKVNLAANIDENFKQLINGGLDLSKVKSGKLDINIHDGDGSSSGGGKRKGGKGKSSSNDQLDLDDLPTLRSGNDSKLKRAIDDMYKHISNKTSKTLEDAVEKATGISFKNTGANRDVHLQAAMAKLATQAQKLQLEGKTDDARALEDVITRISNELAQIKSDYAENGLFGSPSKNKLDRLQLMTTSDYHKQLDSDANDRIEAGNRRRKQYQDSLKSDLKKSQDVLATGNLSSASKLLGKDIRNSSDADYTEELKKLKENVDNFHKYDADEQQRIKSAIKQYAEKRNEQIKNLLDNMKVRSEDFNKSIAQSYMKSLNSANDYAGVNSLDHGEKLENFAWMRDNMAGNYDSAAEHRRKAIEQRKQRLDPLQKEIDDLIVARNKGEKSTLGTNPELLNLINTKLRLMSEIGGADFGLEQQINYIKSLKKKNIDSDAHGMLEKLLNQMVREFEEGYKGTVEGRIKYYNKQISDAFKQIKAKAGLGEDVTSDINRYMGFRSKLLEAQTEKSGGANADYSGASKGMSALANIKGIDSGLLDDIKKAEDEFRRLANAQNAAGDTTKKLENEFKALKDSIKNITDSSGINKLATDLEKVLNAKFSRGDSINKEIGALSQMAISLNNRGLDGEPIAQLARKFQDLAQQAKQVTQAEKQSTKAQTEQNQAIIKAEQELEILAKKLDNAYRAQTKLDKINPWSKQRQTANAYAKKLEEIYNLKRKLGQLRSDGDAAKDLLGRSRVSSNSNFLNSTNSTIQSIFEHVAGKFGRQERYSRDRVNRTSPMENFINYVSYGAKFAGRSAKGSGSALEASAMGIKDAFGLISSSSSMISKGFGVAGLAISAFVGGMAIGIEAISKLVYVFNRLFDVVQRLLQPGIELYQQVTKSTYSMGAAIASNAKFAGSEIALADGLATSANLQKKAMFDAEKSVFDFGEIMTSLSGTLPLLLGRGMSLSEAYKTNLGVASVAKLTNLAPNQVLQETRDLAQGTITARSSQVANALGISSADINGKSADEIFKFFEEKFANYEEVLKRYAETPVGAFEQMMDRMKLVSMKFVEQIAYPFKEIFNYLTDLTGSWVDSAKRTYMRVDMGDGQTEQFFRKFDENNNEIANEGAKYTIQGVMKDLNDNLYLLKDAIEQSAKGEADQEQKALLANYGVNADSLVGNKTAYVDVFKEMFGDVFKPIGEEDFKFSEFFEKLKKDFVDVAEYCSKALDELVQYVANAFGIDINDAVDGTSTTIKFLIDMFVWCIEVIMVDMVSVILEFGNSCSYLIEVLLFLLKVVGNACQILVQFQNLILISFPLLFHAFETFFHWLAAKIKKLLNPLANTSDIDARKDEAYKKLEANSQDFMKIVKGMGNNFADMFGIPHVGDKEFHKFEELWKQGKENQKKYEDSLKQQRGKAKDPTQVKGTAKDKVDEKALREARKAEKKAFDKYIAQLRDALERHIQELKDALDKNEAAYKQGLKNYDAYIQEKMKNELEEQTAKRDELLEEIEAIKNTGKYESEDEREKDLYNADKKLQSINKAIDKLTITQSEVTSILSDSNQLLETLVGLNRSANDKKDNSDVTTKVETKEESLNAEDLLKYNDIKDLDDKKSWTMQYFRESGFASDNASSMLAHTLTNSADLSGNIFGFDSDTLNAYATKAGLNLSDATDMFKTNIMIATDKIKEAIPTDNAYTLDQFNDELKKLGMFIGDADLSVMNQLTQSFKPFMRQITTTTHTLANANSVVNQAVNGYKEWIDVREDGSGTGWMGNVTDDPSIQCDSWTGDVYTKSGIDLGRSIVNDEDFRSVGLWHDSNGVSYDGTTPMADGYKAKPGDTIGWHNSDTDSWHYGIIIDDNMLMSRDSTGGLTTHTFAEARDIFGPVLGIGEIGPLLGGSSNTNVIKDVAEKITRGTASTYTGNGLQAIEMKEKYTTTEFNLKAQLDKYEQNTFDSVKALANSAEAIKKTVEAKFDIIKTTGINDSQRDILVKNKEKLMVYQVQEVIAKQISEQAEAQLEDIESSFDYNMSASASRLDFDAISSNYESIFDSIESNVGNTINTIKDAIDSADVSGNRLVSKSLRQTLYKFTNKLNEFFDKAEEAITKQYEYVEAALNNIGATNLQKEGISRRFNLERSRAFAELYRQKENYYTKEYSNIANQAIKEIDKNGKASSETIKALADVQDRLVKNHWALQQAEELGKFKTALEEANDVFKQALEDGLVDFMTDGVNSVLDGTKTIADAFREMAISILKTMQQFFAKRIIENLMNRLYPNIEDQKSIVDAANWQPRDLFVNKENQTIYNQQMNNPRLESVMREGYIIKNPVNDVVNAYDHGWRPEYEAVNPADALAQQLQKTSNSLGQFDSALWKLIDEANGKTLYPNDDTVEDSANNLSASMQQASNATTKNTASTINNTVSTTTNTSAQEMNTSVEQQGTAIDQQDNLTTQQNVTNTINDNNALAEHTRLIREDNRNTQFGDSSVGGFNAGAITKGAGNTGLTNKNFLSKSMNAPMFGGALDIVNSVFGSAFAQLAGVGFAVKSFMKGDTKEKLLSMLYIESQLIYQILVAINSSLMQIQSTLSFMETSGYATGGYISGPGTSTSDSIPAMLSNGEFVVKANAVRKYGTNFLNAVNDGTFATIKPRHHYASGGLVTETAREATSTVVTELGRGIGTNINNEAHFNLVMASNQEDAMRAFMRSPEGQRIYLDMARKYASATVKF